MSKVKNKEKLSHYFAQAVAEIYALRAAGQGLDLASSPNRGIYDVPPWVKDIKLCRTKKGNFVLAYPENKSAKQFLKAMQAVPELETEESVAEQDLLVEEAQDLLEPVLLSESAPTMDPATPTFKRAALVKQDPDKKPFDFMSNRPVPRVKPVESEKIVEKAEVDTLVVEPTAPSPSRIAELASAFEKSQTAVDGPGKTVRELRAQRKVKQVAALPSASGSGKVSPSVAPGEEVKWRHVPFPDIAVKFAVSLRPFHML
jgi:actin-related protein 6